MPENSNLEHLLSDFTEDELAAVAASLVSADPDDVCSAVFVVVSHGPDGQHELQIVNAGLPGEEPVADLLAHAITHLRGTCRHCAAERKRRAHGR